MEAVLKVRKPSPHPGDWVYFFGFDVVERTQDASLMLDEPTVESEDNGEQGKPGHGPTYKVVFGHGTPDEFDGRIHEFTRFFDKGSLNLLDKFKKAAITVSRILLLKRSDEGFAAGRTCGRDIVADILCNTDAFLVSGVGDTIDRLA